MLKFFRIPFATGGDKTAVPDAADPGGAVSYTEGYGLDYERPITDPARKPIDRNEMNELFFDVTTAVAELQSTGVPEFITAALNGGTAYPYSLGAIVRWTDGRIYQSLAAANVADPTDPAKWGGISVAPATLAAHAVRKDQFDAGVAGSVIQTVNVTYSTSVSTTSATAVDSGLTATITPKYATSKILVLFNSAISIPPSSTAGYYSVYLLRGATIIKQSLREGGPVDVVNSIYHHGNTDMSTEDSPATTAATTYKVQFSSGVAGQDVEAQHANIRVSSMTLMEIAQ